MAEPDPSTDTDEGAPCVVCGKHPHKVVGFDGSFQRYIEAHEPDCPLVLRPPK